MSRFRSFACLLGVGCVALAMAAGGCGGAGNVPAIGDGGDDGSGDATADSSGDGHVGGDGSGADSSGDGAGKDGSGKDATTEGGSEGGSEAGDAGKDVKGNDGPAEGASEGGAETGVEAGAETGAEAGVESGAETGVETGPESGPEAGVEAGPEAGEAATEAGTVCDAVNGTTVFVDPLNGQDVAGNGSDMRGGTADGTCAFKTITFALAHLGTAKTVQVFATAHLGNAGAGLNGETFPLAVPAGVTVTGAPSNVPTIEIPAGANNAGVGFLLATPGSVVQSFALVGNSVGVHGVLATTGSTSATTVGALDVSGMATAGIRVDGTGQLTISPGTAVHDNGGTGQTELSGLHVTGTGQAFITGGGAGAAGITFTHNGQDGILVDGSGSVTIAATVSGTLAGDVITSQNAGRGIVVHQEASSTSIPPLNSITGLLSAKNTLDGAAFFANSNVNVRSSVFAANAGSGILIASTGTGGAQTFDVSRIDLGNDAANDPGKNVLQVSGQNANTLAGLCLDIKQNAGQTLNALGNVWVTGNGSVADCAAAAAQLTEGSPNKDCAGGVDVGGTGLTNGITLNANAIDVAMCSCGLVGTTCQ